MKRCTLVVFSLVLSCIVALNDAGRRRRYNEDYLKAKFAWRNETAKPKDGSSFKIPATTSDPSFNRSNICWQRSTRMDRREQRRELESEMAIQKRLHKLVDLLPRLTNKTTSCWLLPIRYQVIKLRAEYESKIETYRKLQTLAERSPDLASNDSLCQRRPTRKDIIKLRNEYVRKIEIHKRLHQLAELLPQMPRNCSLSTDINEGFLVSQLSALQRTYRVKKRRPYRRHRAKKHNYSFGRGGRRKSSRKPVRVLQKRAARLDPRYVFEDPQNWRARRREIKTKKCNKETHLMCSNRCVKLQSVCDGEVDCPNGEDEADCEYMDINLENGRRAGEGRVDLTISNIRGTICDQGWDDKAAIVICRMMGYKNPEQAKATRGLRFGRGWGAIWMSQVSCNGSEDHIHSCITSVWGEHSCTHAQDAGVICMPRKDHTEDVQTTPKNFLPDQPPCGQRIIPQRGSKILGGRTTVYGALPWQARVMRYKYGQFYHQCGGTIIGTKWIVTAAHCFDNLSAEQAWVTVGDHDSGRKDLKEHRFKVDQIFLPPQYKSIGEMKPSFDFSDIFSFFGRKTLSAPYESFTHDIALLKLKPSTDGRYINFNSHVQPACLPTTATPYQPGLRCEVSGWGFSGHNPARLPEALQYAIVPIMSTQDCEKAYQTTFEHELPREMFCAGFARGGVDTCQGDSGGPLVCNIHGSHTLLGVTSWGFECGESHHAGVYTKVGVVADWIDEVLGANKKTVYSAVVP